MNTLTAKLKQGINQASEYIKNEDYQTALELLKNLKKEFPDDVMVNGLLASTYASLNMMDKAKDCYEHILKLDSNNHLARFQYGLLFFQNADHTQALNIWQPLLDIEEEFTCKFFASQSCHATGDIERARILVDGCIRAAPKNHPLYEQALSLQQALAS